MSDDIMDGFLYMKALIARYGTEGTTDLVRLAQRAVDSGLYPTRRAAVEAIERHMGEPVTTPLSEEAASYTTGRGPGGV